MSQRVYYVVTRMQACPKWNDAMITTEVFKGDWTLVRKCTPEFVREDRAQAVFDRQHRTCALAFASLTLS